MKTITKTSLYSTTPPFKRGDRLLGVFDGDPPYGTAVAI